MAGSTTPLRWWQTRLIDPSHPRWRQRLSRSLILFAGVLVLATVFAFAVLDQDPWWRWLVYPVWLAGLIARDGWRRSPPEPSTREQGVVVERLLGADRWEVALTDGRRFPVTRPLRWSRHDPIAVGDLVVVEVWSESGAAKLRTRAAIPDAVPA